MKSTILSWGMFALALVSFAPTVQAQQKNSTPANSSRSSTTTWSNRQVLTIDVDSSTTPPQIIAMLKSDSLYNMVISQGQLTSLYVNGKQVPAENLYLYHRLVNSIIDQMRRDSMQAIRDKEQAGRDQEQAERDEKQAIRDKKQAEMDARQAEMDAKQAGQEKKLAEMDARQGKREREQAAREKEQAEREAVDAKTQAERDKEQSVRDKEQADRDKRQSMRDKEQALRDKRQAELDMQQAMRDKKQAEEDRALLQSLLAEVVKEGLAPDEKSIVSLVLDDTEFVVNGKKQSDEMQRKFSAKFILRKGFGFYIHGNVKQIGQMN